MTQNHVHRLQSGWSFITPFNGDLFQMLVSLKNLFAIIRAYFCVSCIGMRRSMLCTTSALYADSHNDLQLPPFPTLCMVSHARAPRRMCRHFDIWCYESRPWHWRLVFDFDNAARLVILLTFGDWLMHDDVIIPWVLIRTAENLAPYHENTGVDGKEVAGGEAGRGKVKHGGEGDVVRVIKINHRSTQHLQSTI